MHRTKSNCRSVSNVTARQRGRCHYVCDGAVGRAGELRLTRFGCAVKPNRRSGCGRRPLAQQTNGWERAAASFPGSGRPLGASCRYRLSQPGLLLWVSGDRAAASSTLQAGNRKPLPPAPCGRLDSLGAGGGLFQTQERLGTGGGLFPLRAVDRKEGPYRYRLSQPFSRSCFSTRSHRNLCHVCRQP